MDTNEIILQELRAVRQTLDELAVDARERITALEVQTHPLFDNGQPGRCNRMEAWGKDLNAAMDTRVTKLEHWKIYTMGYTIGAAGAVSALVAIILKMFAN